MCLLKNNFIPQIGVLLSVHVKAVSHDLKFICMVKLDSSWKGGMCRHVMKIWVVGRDLPVIYRRWVLYLGSEEILLLFLSLFAQIFTHRYNATMHFRDRIFMYKMKETGT